MVTRGGSRKSLRVVLLVGEANLPRSGFKLASKRGSLGGSGGMPPQKILGNMDALRPEVQFGALLSNRYWTHH